MAAMVNVEGATSAAGRELDYVVFTVGVLTLLLQYNSQLLIFMVLGSYLMGICLMLDDDDYLNNEINHWISHRIGI